MTVGELQVADSVGEAEWDALADELDAAPFLRREWFESWNDAFGPRPLRTLAAVRGGRIVGVLPLRSRAGFVASPTNWHTPEFDVLAREAEPREALIAAAATRASWQLELSFVDRATADLAAAVAARSGRRAAARVIERSPYIDLTGSFDDYRAGLPRHAVKEIARRRRRLADVGEIDIEVHETFTEEVLADFCAVEQAGWKGAQGTAVATDAAASRFYRSVAEWASARGWLRIAVVRVAGRPVAADFSLEHGGRHYTLKTGYDEEFRAYGPGKLLRMEMIERAFGAGLTSYEFLGAEAAWKAEWTSKVRDRMRVQVFAAGPRGRVVELAQVQGRGVARSAREGVAQWRSRR